MSPLSAKLCRTVLLPLAVAALIAGCAKKPVATIEPPPTPPVVANPSPTPTPPVPAPPTETAPSPSGVRSEDFQAAFFDYDSYTLRDDARAALDKNARVLRDNPMVTITIEGHCDERGTAEYNQALGERRAQAARDYLVAAGIENGRLEMLSYGKERPFSMGHDEAAFQQNRRAHFVVRGAS